MGNTASANDASNDDTEVKKAQDLEEQFGAGRSLVRSASFDDEKQRLAENVGMDSSHGVLKRVYVDVPKGVRSGQYFTVHVNGQDLEVRCPPAYSRISNRVVVELPIDSNPALVAKNLPPRVSTSLSASVKSADKEGSVNPPTQIKKSKRFYLTVPKGVRSGKYFPVHVQGYDLMVKCPPAYSRISDRIVIEVPADLINEDEITPGHEPEMYRMNKKERGVSLDEGKPHESETRGSEVLSQTSEGSKPAGTAASLITPIKPTGNKAMVERVYVRIPKGTRSGQLFTVNVRGHDISVRCPPAYSRISDRVLIEVPLEPPSDTPVVMESRNVVSVPSSRMSETGAAQVNIGVGRHADENAAVISRLHQGQGARSVQSAPEDISLDIISRKDGKPATHGLSTVLNSVATGGVMSSSAAKKKKGDTASLLKDSE